MKHFMKLNALPFALMKSGKKYVELRLNDEKRRCVAVGDEIEFTCVETGEVLLTVVKHRHEYADFHTLYENFDKERLGYLPKEPASPDDMLEYYSADDVNRYGVVGLEIEIL